MELKTIGTKVKCLFDGGEDRGVSPVIGVILMVAITVILAAVIGAFVLNLGNDLDASQTPTASVSTEVVTDESGVVTDVVFTHNSGASMDGADLRVVGDGRHTVTEGYGEFGSGSTLSAATDSGHGADFTGTDSVSLVYDDGESSVSLATASL